MRRRLSVLAVVTMLFFGSTLPVLGQCYSAKKRSEIYSPVFSPYKPAEWGYNYANGHFSGLLANVYLANLNLPAYVPGDGDWIGEWQGTDPYGNPLVVANQWWWQEGLRNAGVTMQWNDAFLAGTSCDGDRYLDRHRGFASYRGSGAEVKIRVSDLLWSLFYVVQAVPADAVLSEGVWYGADGTPIGAAVWPELGGEFVVATERSQGEFVLPQIPAPQYF